MANNDRQVNLSPSGRQRTKSQSSSRSHRTPPNTLLHDDDLQREKTSLSSPRRNTRGASAAKRSESSTSNRSTRITSPLSNTSRKTKIDLNVTTPPTYTTRRRSSKRKKSAISKGDVEKQQSTESNDSEKQDLSMRGLAMVPPEIFELITLRRLNLSNNNLSGLPSTIGLLINLEYLDLSQNPLFVRNGHNDYSCLPREFRHLKNLHTLIIAECTLKHIPFAVWNTTSLQTLDLNRNKVGYIVADIGNLTELRHLRLSQMDLDTIPPEIGFCDKLETLDLSGNPIDTLPETLIECRLLTVLKINYKNFYKILDNYMLQLIDDGKIRSEHIPQVIFELENLNSLDLSQTKINSISNEHRLLHLTELYLSNNCFFDIPESICTIYSLKILDLSYNRILVISESFNQLKELEFINLSFNRLNSLSKIPGQLPSLKKLNLKHNQIDNIDKDFSKSKSILILDLSYNHLVNIPIHLCELEQLESLDLRYNRFHYLPAAIYQMKGLKSMNIFANTFQRTGLHLIGNDVIEPPGYIWKSTDIRTLHNYIETKEKIQSHSYCHLKLILLGPKNIGKTTLAMKLINERKNVSKTRKTIDMYVSMIEDRQLKTTEIENIQQQQTLTDGTSSGLIDQWIENRISTSGDYVSNHPIKPKRIYPPPIRTYRSMEKIDFILKKSIIITKNNFYFTIFDLTNEPSYEILYPLIYDSNALYILPINLTILLNNNQQSTEIDFEKLLNYNWLHSHIFRYLESISDHCEEVFIAIIGLIDRSQIKSFDKQQSQQILEEIHLRIDEYLIDMGNQRGNINLYSGFFPEPFHIDNEQISSIIIQQLELIAQQWNLIHHKQKRQFIKQRLKYLPYDHLIIDYQTCLKQFEERKQQQNSSSDEDENEIIKNELNQMSFDDYLDYLKLIGDILYFNPNKSNRIILLKPYYFLNEILSTTIFRPHIEQWLNYDDNMIFRFTGHYLSQELFNFDRQRLLIRGEFTWKMLNVLFHEQNNHNHRLTQQNLLNYCQLMEQFYLGFINESNIKHGEFSMICFVCPWLINEKCSIINYREYFKSLEQERQYEYLRRERTRRRKQQQLWFSLDTEQENLSDQSALQAAAAIAIQIPDLPMIDQIEIAPTQIIADDSIVKLKIINENLSTLPNGLYERLLICLHPLFNERLDYSNFTLGRTIDRYLIQIEYLDEQNQIHLTIQKNLIESIKTLILDHLFLLYPRSTLRIET